MPLYEHVFLARQDVTAQQVEDKPFGITRFCLPFSAQSAYNPRVPSILVGS